MFVKDGYASANSGRREDTRRTRRTPGFTVPTYWWEGPFCTFIGSVIAVGLFVVVALTQGLDADPERLQIHETLIAINPPTIEEIEEEPIEVEPEEEAPPELETAAAPSLTLDQLDIALRPGSGTEGAVVGDFAMPAFGALRVAPTALEPDVFVDFSDLDQIPRPIGVTGFNFPRRLRAQPVHGTIVLLLKLSSSGEVLEVGIQRSDLPRFDDFVLNAVASWRFTPPTRDGQPVKAQARLPIPIRIS